MLAINPGVSKPIMAIFNASGISFSTLHHGTQSRENVSTANIIPTTKMLSTRWLNIRE